MDDIIWQTYRVNLYRLVQQELTYQKYNFQFPQMFDAAATKKCGQRQDP